jgi:hypothetical protein
MLPEQAASLHTCAVTGCLASAFTPAFHAFVAGDADPTSFVEVHGHLCAAHWASAVIPPRHWQYGEDTETLNHCNSYGSRLQFVEASQEEDSDGNSEA